MNSQEAELGFGLDRISVEPAPDLVPGVRAWTTRRDAGSFGLGSEEPVAEVLARWGRLQDELEERDVMRLASAHQTHSAIVARHEQGWRGWLRMRGVDGHFSMTPGTALAVTIADCTPVFMAHPDGAIAVLHAGWRGAAGGILDVGLALFAEHGHKVEDCVIHLGPAICGPCYEVGPEVLSAIHGRPIAEKGQLDVRAVLVSRAEARGVRQVSVSDSCTRCNNDRFFSHRAGDSGRQLGIIALDAS
jgi:polyphenol oxidase